MCLLPFRIATTQQEPLIIFMLAMEFTLHTLNLPQQFRYLNMSG